MHPRILSSLEEKQIRSYLKHDDEKNLNMCVLASRGRKHLPQMHADLELLEKLLETYERDKTK